MKRKIIAYVCALVTAFSAAGSSLYFTADAPLHANAALRGDIDENGNVNTEDVRALVEFLTKQRRTVSNADMNQDGIVNATDLALLKRQLLGSSSAANGLRINEVCSTNKKSLKANDGTSPDWIEIYNSGSTSCDLSGVGLSDGDKNRFKFTFPQGSVLKSGEYLIVFCDDTENNIYFLVNMCKSKKDGQSFEKSKNVK